MADAHYEVTCDGYWRESHRGGLPAQSGVYCVYTCSYDPVGKTVTLHRLVYIGEAENVRQRVATHDRWTDWRKHLGPNQELCLSAAPVTPTARPRVEAALIFRHKPPTNTEYTDSFPFDRTSVRTAGKSKFLEPHFTVVRTP